MDLTPGKKFLELEPPQNRPAPKPWCHVQYRNNTVEKLSIFWEAGGTSKSLSTQTNSWQSSISKTAVLQDPGCEKLITDPDPALTLIPIRIQERTIRIRIQQKGLGTRKIFKKCMKNALNYVLWVYTT